MTTYSRKLHPVERLDADEQIAFCKWCADHLHFRTAQLEDVLKNPRLYTDEYGWWQDWLAGTDPYPERRVRK